MNTIGYKHEYRARTMEIAKLIGHAIVETFGHDACEAVIHDISDLEHSIVWIEGDVTHRAIGDGMTDFGLAIIRAGRYEDFYNYRTYLADGSTLKSSTLFLRDPDGQPWGTFCLNFNITPLLYLYHFLDSLALQVQHPEIHETFTKTVEETIQSLIVEAAAEIGRSIPELNYADRIQLIRILDERGAFQMRRAVPIIAKTLGVSRTSIYNYHNGALGNSDTNKSDFPSE